MIEALYDDLNTAQAMAVLHGLRNAAASGGERERERVCGLAAAARLPLDERCGMEGTQAAGERRRCESRSIG